MNITNAIACLLVTLDCILMAGGAQPEHIFGPRYRWIWWLVAVPWGGATLVNIATALQ